MKYSLVVLALAVAAAGAAQLGPGQADHVLDTLAYVSTPEPEPTIPQRSGWIEGGLGGGISGEQRAARLTVSLLSLDSGSYETGDPVIYEVWIENIGDSSVTLPWSPDRVPFSMSAPGLPKEAVRGAALFLEVRTRTGVPLGLLYPVSLFGSEDILPGSVATLAPGETAWIRASGFWRSTHTEAMLSQPDGFVHVGVVLSVPDSRLRVRSANAIEVHLQSRLRRFR